MIDKKHNVDWRPTIKKVLEESRQEEISVITERIDNIIEVLRVDGFNTKATAIHMLQSFKRDLMKGE